MARTVHIPRTPFNVWSIVTFIAISLGSVVGQSAFLATQTQTDLLRELEVAVGHHYRFSTESRVSRLEEAMRPTFNALPKDKSGRLGASGVRYMLHRLFVQRHGWFVSGLESNGEAWNSSSPTDMVGTHVGMEAQIVFDTQLNTRGFDLHHAAVLAATLENFVHVEAVGRLEAAYNLVGLSPDVNNASEDQVAQAMKTYMLMFVLGKNYSNATTSWLDAAFSIVRDIYPTWDDTVRFVDEVRHSVLYNDNEEADVSMMLSWNTTLRILETVGERYGKWQNRECMDIKSKLVEMEDPNTGRVPLPRFYGYGNSESDKAWLFRESVQYLKTLGALDDSDPSRLSVIIPNYLNGANNCAAGSKFYDVCCIDECDALISHLEQTLAAPEASPQLILDIVAALPSNTVSAPRELPNIMSLRLRDIAQRHGGKVPLHARLFAQWMHHAYPRECAYPHISGTSSSQNPMEFIVRGGSATITPEELSSLVKDLGDESTTTDKSDRTLPWTSEEELFVCRPGVEVPGAPEDGAQDEGWSRALVVKALLMLTFSCVFLFARLRPKRKGGWLARSDEVSKYYV